MHYFKIYQSREISDWLQNRKYGKIKNILIFTNDYDTIQFKLKFFEHIETELEIDFYDSVSIDQLINFVNPQSV